MRVNGRVRTSPSLQLGEDDKVTVDLPDRPNFVGMSLTVLYQNDSVIVINKPAGVLTHAKGEPCDEFTVAEFVRPLTSDNPGSNRSGIVHRLDRDTSGVIICALNGHAHKFLQRQFSDRKVKKIYIARLCRVPKLPKARLELPIGRNPKRPQTFQVISSGRMAISEYKVLKNLADGSCLVELRPLTGRTHQLRVHMAHIGAPICGDKLYGDRQCRCRQTTGRMMLHALSLEITVPALSGNRRRVFTAPLPPEFETPYNRT